MALVSTVLKAQILQATQAASKATTEAMAADIFAEQLSIAIDVYIKSGDVNTLVVTAGSPTSQTGTGTGRIT